MAKYNQKTLVTEHLADVPVGGVESGGGEKPNGAAPIPYPMTNCNFALSWRGAPLNEKMVAFWMASEDDEPPSYFPSVYDEKIMIIAGPLMGLTYSKAPSSVFRFKQVGESLSSDYPLYLTLEVKALIDGKYKTDSWPLGVFKEIYLCPDIATLNRIVAKIKEENPHYISYVFEDFYDERSCLVNPSEVRDLSGEIIVDDWDTVFVEQVSLT